MNKPSTFPQYPYLPFVSIMLMVGLVVTTVSISVLYRISMGIEQTKILEFVESQARLITAIARFDAQFSTDSHPLGAKQATLNQLLITLKEQRNKKNEKLLILGHRNSRQELVLDHAPHEVNPSQPLTGIIAEALKLALEGHSGNVWGIDHNGNHVLAAYIELPDINRALVATVDTQELRRPFIHASIIAIAIALIMIILGSILFNQIQKLKIQKSSKLLSLDSHSGLKEYERLIYFVIVMTCICIAVNLSSAITLYWSSYNRSQEHLLHLVSNQAHLIESVAKFDQQHSQNDHSQGARGATLSQVINAFNQNLGFGETGEYVIGQRVGDEIDIIYHQRQQDAKKMLFPFLSPRVAPMRLALIEETGVILANDHLQRKVLAAYTPLKSLGYGLVAKIDLSEIQAPFIRSTLVTSSFAILIIVLASVLLARITRAFEAVKKVNTYDNFKKEGKIEVESIPYSLVFFTSSLTLGIFLLDIVSPIGIASGAPYIAVVAMSWWFPQRKHIIFIAICVSILSIIMLLSTAEIEEWKSWINRSYSLFVIWVTALTLNLAKASDLARKQQARTLKKLSMAVEYSPSGVMITDPEGIIEYVNPRFLINSNYTFNEIIGHKPSILNSGETSQETFEDMWKTISSGQEWRGEIINRKKNGELYWEDNAIVPIISKEGSIQNYVCLKENITRRKKAEEVLVYNATHDSLTDLAGPLLARDHLEMAIAQAKRNKTKVAVLFIDLDGFKAVNDTFGHEAGDLVLKEVANRLKQSTREVDTIARIGGDEFLIILGEIKKIEDSTIIAKNIINLTSQPYQKIENQLELESNEKIQIGSSIGIAIYPDSSVSSDVDKLIKLADSAMYTIKQQGKNNFSIYKNTTN